jgi:ATP-dependent Clp protease protease subunit
MTKTAHKVDEKISSTHDYWIDPESREMWIHGVDVSSGEGEWPEPGVEYNMATTVIKNLHYLRKQSETKEVVIHLHTCGGEVGEGFAIYDTIRLMPYPVTIISYTHARSMSSIILQAAAGESDKRLLLPSSHFMFHWGSIVTGGHAIAVYSEVDFYKKYDELMLDIYVDCVKKGVKFKGKTESQIRKYLKDMMNKKSDVFLTAEEAVEWGFADGILERWPSNAKWKKV